MFAFRIFQGNAESFGEYVAAFDTLGLLTGRQESIYNIIMSQRESGFLFRERDIMIVMLPSVSLIKKFKADKHQDWVPICNAAYIEYRQLYENASTATSDKNLEQVLDIMESFHTLQRIPPDQSWCTTYYKCTCADCHKNCICV